MPARASASPDPTGSGVGSMFDLLPIGAYRSRPDGTMLRANAALVRLNGYAEERELLAAVHDIGREWYVDPSRRDDFRALLEHHGEVRAFVSEIFRHKTRERVWISENAHVVLDAEGRPLYYEGTVEEVTARVQAEQALRQNEQVLREIAANVPGLVYRVHIAPDGRRRYTFVSDAVRELFGIEPATLMAQGDMLRTFVHPEDFERVVAEIAASRLSGRTAHAEFRVVPAGGGLKWVQMAASTVLTREPGMVRMGVMIDITARKQADLALRESEKRWKLALESIGDGLWDWDIGSGREVVSPQLLAMYGLTEADHDGSADVLDALTHPDDVEPMRRDREAHLQGRTATYVNEHRVRHRDGSWRWVLSRGTVIERDAAGRPLRMIGTHTDIGERKDAENLRRERARAEAAQRTQTAFLSRVSHELRTPLNAVIGFAQLLELERVGTPRHQGWVGSILDSGRHLLALVNDLLDLSSAQTGQLQFSTTAVDLPQRLRSVWTMHEGDAISAGVQFVDRLPASGTHTVLADPTRLSQVLSNLLSNAIKYNRRGGRVEVSLEAADGVVALSVADSGQGMDEAQLARLFTPFERAGAQHSTIAGTGLGLALATQLVEAMGGHIVARSTPGQGSVFVVTLNAART